MTPRDARRLVGRTIVHVALNPSWEGEGRGRVRLFDPRLTLDDGSVLRFIAEEHPDGADPCVDMIHERARKR